MAEATETFPHGSYSPLTAPPSEVTLKQPVNIDIQLDHNPSVEPEMSLTGRPTDDGERRVVTTAMHFLSSTWIGIMSANALSLFRPLDCLTKLRLEQFKCSVKFLFDNLG